MTGQGKRIVVVLGMHRSGTSAIARGLKALGVELGERLMPPAAGNNEKGFWEDIDANALNAELLEHLGYSWDALGPIPRSALERVDLNPFRLRAVELLRERLADVTLFGLKDPRISRLLPFWKSAFERVDAEVSCIISSRNPLSVARSLERRDGMDAEVSHYLWLEHVTACMLESEGCPRLVVDYDALMTQPRLQLERVSRTLGLPFDPSSPELGEYSGEFLTEDLRHSRFVIDDLELAEDLPPGVTEAFALMTRLARDEEQIDSRPVHEFFKRAHERLDEMRPALAFMTRKARRASELAKAVADRDERIDGLQRGVADRDNRIHALNLAVAEQDRLIRELNSWVTDRDNKIHTLNQGLAAQGRELERVEGVLAQTGHRFVSRIGGILEPYPALRWAIRGSIRLAQRAATVVGFRATETETATDATGRDLSSRAYARWVEMFEPRPDQYGRFTAEEASWTERPLISVVMPTYNTPEALLRAAIESVTGQLYPHWELCVADDASPDPRVRAVLEEYAAKDSRIKVVYRDANGHISAASNSAVRLATGEFVALLDHDDMLHPLALHFVAEAIVRNPGCELVYSDEDKIGEDGRRQDPYFKSDFNYDLLLGQNMISHLGAYRTERLRAIGGFSEGLDGSQDYDLALRFVEVIPEKAVIHIPRVLYHWRLTAGSTSVTLDNKNYAFLAARDAIQAHLGRVGIEAKVSGDSGIKGHTRVVYPVPEPEPLVSVIIPTRDRVDLLAHAVDAVTSKCAYARTQVIVVDNGSIEARSLHFFARLERRGVAIVRDDRPFNFSALNNLGARSARGSLLLFLNNDIEALGPDWLAEMVAQGSRKDVGAVGAKLLYPDGTIQHAGVILGLGGLAAHSHHGAPGSSPGYFGRAGLTCEVSAVTGACLLTPRSLFEKLGGFDEELPVAYNDVDYCLRVREQGYKVIYTPYSTLVHNESATRGSDAQGARQWRLEADKARMRSKWGARLERDPFYSPNLTLTEHGGYSLRWQ